METNKIIKKIILIKKLKEIKNKNDTKNIYFDEKIKNEEIQKKMI